MTCVAVLAVVTTLTACAYHAADTDAALASAPSTQPVGNATLRIRVTDVRSENGQLILGVFRSDRGFPSSEKDSVNWQIGRAAKDGTIEFSCELPPGRYGASVLHDENENNRMDTNLIGIPNEGYGVTNNPKPRFRAATFKESVFTLPAEGAQVTISLQYF